jgi:uncharacterized protein
MTMIASPAALDLILILLFAVVWPLVEWRWTHPRSRRSIAAGLPGARINLYRDMLIPQWGFTACVAALWIAYSRPWSALLLGSSTPLRLGIGLLVVVLVLCLLWRQWKAIRARKDGLALVRRQLGHADTLIPHTLGERRIFFALSITAGICEEILFRGYLMWYIAVWFHGIWTGRVLAVVISSLLFGFGHIYLGGRNALKAGIAGVFAALIALVAGSLLPVMIIHAALDLNSGALGYRAFSEQSAAVSD